VALFRDAQDVYDTIGRIFEEAIADPEIGPKTKQAGISIRYEFTEPDCVLDADFSTGVVTYGADVPAREADVKMVMKAEVANKFWLGKVNLVMAMAKRQVKASGSVPEMLKMLPLAKPLYARYEAQLKASGREDLIRAAG
jgi:putative sterol carrier protein